MIERITMHRGFTIELDLLMEHFTVKIEDSTHKVETLTEVYQLIDLYYRNGGKVKVLNLKTLEITEVSEFTYHKLIDGNTEVNYLMVTDGNMDKINKVKFALDTELSRLFEEQTHINESISQIQSLIKRELMYDI